MSAAQFVLVPRTAGTGGIAGRRGFVCEGFWCVRGPWLSLFWLLFPEFFQLASFLVLKLRMQDGLGAVDISRLGFRWLVCGFGLLFGQFETGEHDFQAGDSG